jgi:NAD(P)-dependent dehydrogenase (short-subunit alcohol dehydrogenase family)
VECAPTANTTEINSSLFRTVPRHRLYTSDGPASWFADRSPSGHRYSNVDRDNPRFERTSCDPSIAYGRSNTTNVLFAAEFDRRHRAHGVRATALHPGEILTELGRHPHLASSR